MPRVPKFDAALIRRLQIPAGKAQADWYENLEPGRSLILSKSYAGSVTWGVLFYVASKPKRSKLGAWPDLSVREARRLARNFDTAQAQAKAAAGSFEQVAEQWMKHHVRANGLRSERELRRHLTKHIFPAWRARPFIEVRRSHVNALLDEIAEASGPSQADAVLSTVRGICVWYQSRTEDYVSPVVPKMRRDKRSPTERARSRILDDDELKAVWLAAEKLGGNFGSIIRLALLTGQRRGKVASMRWSDIDEDGVWTVPAEAREKGTGERLQLPKAALDIIKARPRIAGNDYVHAAPRRKKVACGFNSWSEMKTEIDLLLPADMERWTPHDLRRTCRSLMAKIGVQDSIAERVLGHRQAGVEAIYNRHRYEDEKAAALKKLAGEIDRIVKGQKNAKVIPIRARS